MKALKKQLGEEVREGRPKGSGTAEHTVREWQEKHQTGRKSDCIRDTGLAKHTVYKWWKDINNENILGKKELFNSSFFPIVYCWRFEET